MGHRVSANLFRLGTNKTWNSHWFAKSEYNYLISLDYRIRDFIDYIFYNLKWPTSELNIRRFLSRNLLLEILVFIPNDRLTYYLDTIKFNNTSNILNYIDPFKFNNLLFEFNYILYYFTHKVLNKSIFYLLLHKYKVNYMYLQRSLLQTYKFIMNINSITGQFSSKLRRKTNNILFVFEQVKGNIRVPSRLYKFDRNFKRGLSIITRYGDRNSFGFINNFFKNKMLKYLFLKNKYLKYLLPNLNIYFSNIINNRVHTNNYSNNLKFFKDILKTRAINKRFFNRSRTLLFAYNRDYFKKSSISQKNIYNNYFSSKNRTNMYLLHKYNKYNMFNMLSNYRICKENVFAYKKSLSDKFFFDVVNNNSFKKKSLVTLLLLYKIIRIFFLIKSKIKNFKFNKLISKNIISNSRLNYNKYFKIIIKNFSRLSLRNFLFYLQKNKKFLVGYDHKKLCPYLKSKRSSFFEKFFILPKSKRFNLFSHVRLKNNLVRSRKVKKRKPYSFVFIKNKFNKYNAIDINKCIQEYRDRINKFNAKLIRKRTNTYGYKVNNGFNKNINKYNKKNNFYYKNKREHIYIKLIYDVCVNDDLYKKRYRKIIKLLHSSENSKRIGNFSFSKFKYYVSNNYLNDLHYLNKIYNYLNFLYIKKIKYRPLRFKQYTKDDVKNNKNDFIDFLKIWKRKKNIKYKYSKKYDKYVSKRKSRNIFISSLNTRKNILLKRKNKNKLYVRYCKYFKHLFYSKFKKALVSSETTFFKNNFKLLKVYKINKKSISNVKKLFLLNSSFWYLDINSFYLNKINYLYKYDNLFLQNKFYKMYNNLHNIYIYKKFITFFNYLRLENSIFNNIKFLRFIKKLYFSNKFNFANKNIFNYVIFIYYYLNNRFIKIQLFIKNIINMLLLREDIITQSGYSYNNISVHIFIYYFFNHLKNSMLIINFLQILILIKLELIQSFNIKFEIFDYISNDKNINFNYRDKNNINIFYRYLLYLNKIQLSMLYTMQKCSVSIYSSNRININFKNTLEYSSFLRLVPFIRKHPYYVLDRKEILYDFSLINGFSIPKVSMPLSYWKNIKNISAVNGLQIFYSKQLKKLLYKRKPYFYRYIKDKLIYYLDNIRRDEISKNSLELFCNNIEYNLSLYTHYPVKFMPMFSLNKFVPFYNARLICLYVSYELEKGVPYFLVLKQIIFHNRRRLHRTRNKKRFLKHLEKILKQSISNRRLLKFIKFEYINKYCIDWQSKSVFKYYLFRSYNAFNYYRKLKYKLGIRISCSGRMYRRQTRSHTMWFSDGALPLRVYNKHIDYYNSNAITRLGSIGVKVWIFLSDILRNLDALVL